MKYLVAVMVITVNVIRMTHACNFTCPKNKPYCSNVGCVFECLHPFFINGTYCVADCGHLVVDQDRHCIETCPAGTFILETLKQVNANQYLEKKCVQCNVTEGFIQNNECVKLCSENWKYIEDENHARCIQECPADNIFTTKVQRFGVSHNQCVAECLDPFYTNDTNCVVDCEPFFVDTNRHCIETCPSETFSMGKMCVLCNKYGEFVKGNECVYSCPESWNFIQDEHYSKCLQECLVDAPLINPISYFDGEYRQCVANCTDLVDEKYCVTSCPNGKVRFGKHCLYDCPFSAPYMFNGECYSGCQTSDINLITDNFTCVKICPQERPFIMNNSCVSNCPEVISIDKYCAAKCDEHDMLFNNSCLGVCPPLTVTFNKTCIEKCPAESPLACRTTKSQACGSDPGNNGAHTVCVNQCPDNMFLWKNTCLYECPRGIPSFERECTDECPFYSPYQITYYLNSGCDYFRCVNSKMMLKCTAECPDNTFIYNMTCLFYCPFPLFQFEKNCITKCPDNSPVRINSTVSISVWELRNLWWYGLRFVRDTKTVDVVKCVSSCDASHVQVDFMCSDKCPEAAPFVFDRVCNNDECTTKYIEYAEIGIVCIESCYLVENNNICYRKCPQNLMVYNRSCVAKCPNSHRYVVQSTYENCDYICSPEELRFECKAVCPRGSFTKQYNCVNFCEPPQYTFQTECLSICPISAQYIDDSVIQVSVFQNFSTYIKLTNVRQHIRSCVSACPSNKVLNEHICTESCPIQSIFIRNRKCSNETCATKWTYRESGLGIFCLDECPVYTLKYNQTCVSRCPVTHKVFDSTCVPYCPLSAEFTSKEPRETDLFNCTSNIHVGKICSNATHHICKKECPANRYIEERTCVPKCPYGHFNFGQICLKQCPDSAPFIQPIRISVTMWHSDIYVNNDLFWYHQNVEQVDQFKCAEDCSNGFYKLGNSFTCVTKCTNPFPLHFNNDCVGTCPVGTLLDDSRQKCVYTCPTDTTKYNGSCNKNCPEHLKFTFNSECISECPDSAPFGLKNDRFTCRKSCGDDKLFKDGDCIYQYQCEDPWFEFAGACIKTCPTGFVWFSSCINTIPLYIIMPGLILMFIVELFCVKQFLWDGFQVITCIWNLQERIKTIQSQMWSRNESRHADVDANVRNKDLFYLNKQYIEDKDVTAPDFLRSSESENFR